MGRKDHTGKAAGRNRASVSQLEILSKLFATVIVCGPKGAVHAEYGKRVRARNVLADPRFASLRPLILECLGGQAFETYLSMEGNLRARVRGVPLHPGLALAIEDATPPFAKLRRDRLSTPEYEFIVTNMRQGFWRINTKGMIEGPNEFLAAWLETTVDAMIGKPASDYLLSVDDEGPRFEGEFVTSSGLHRRAIVVRSPMVGPRGKAIGTIDIITDITAEHAMRTKLVEEVQRMSRLARTDPLTGLANRMEYEERLRRVSGIGEPYAVILADMDDFKEINDTYGHAAGDDALREVARRLQMGVRDTDLIARLGGDEFAVLLIGASREVAHEVVERLRHRLDTPSVPPDPPVRVSIGWAHQDDHGDAVAAADAAMYREKRRRKNSGS